MASPIIVTPDFWSKLETGGTKELGETPAVTGTLTPINGAFGYGIESAGTGNGQVFAMPGFTWEKGAISVWVKCKDWSVTNGIRSDGNQHAILSYYSTTGTGNYGAIYFVPSGLQMFGTTLGPVATGWTTGLNISANTWTHLVFSWGPGKQTMYVNKVEVSPTTTGAINSAIAYASTAQQFGWGVPGYGQAVCSSNAWIGAQDNLIIMNHEVTQAMVDWLYANESWTGGYTRRRRARIN